MASQLAQRTRTPFGCSSSGRQCATHAPVSRRPQVVRAALTAEKATLEINKMDPIHDRVLIKPLDEEPRSAGGILLPKGPPKANSEAHIGEVMSVGEDVKFDLKKGDTVLFNKYAMAEVEVPEGDILFVAEKSILAKLEQ